jgi:transcriptional regulator with GAF, ATPase, and Fis domain
MTRYPADRIIGGSGFTKIPADRFKDRSAAYDRHRPLVEGRSHFPQPQESNPEILAAPAAMHPTLLGDSLGLHRVLAEIEMVAPTTATVLINGETGVGKELVARSIHERSPRFDHAMVTVNCTAVPRDLFESEFFGHVRGAFSGASRDRMGRLLLADGGTLFLDEVGDLPLEIQPKLLRVLEEGEFEAVGDDITQRIGIRVIAASNRDLEETIRAGQFREDLFYRLNVFPIEVPPLRERKGDIGILAVAFLEAACDRFDRICPALTEGQLSQLSDYDWPGNVRELQNIVDRAVIRAPHGNLQFDIPNHRRGSACEPPVDRCASRGEVEVVRDDEMKRRERENLAAALRHCCGKIYGPGGAANLLGIPPTTLNARLKKLGLKDFKTPDET